MLAPWKKTYDQPGSIIKSRGITLPTKVHVVKAMFFPVVMYGFESWTIKKAEHWRIDAFELWCWRRLLRVPWDFFGRNDAKAKTPVLWPPHAKSWLIGKDPDAEKDWRQEEGEITEDELIGWHHWLNGHEFEQALGEGILACGSPWGRKQSDTTEQLRSSGRLEDTKHIMREGWPDETTFDGLIPSCH